MMAGVLELDADSVVVYVGGHPDDFKVATLCFCLYFIYTLGIVGEGESDKTYLDYLDLVK